MSGRIPTPIRSYALTASSPKDRLSLGTWDDRALSESNGVPNPAPGVQAGLGVAPEKKVAWELAQRARLPYVDLSTVDFDPCAGRFLKPELARRYGCVPFAADSSTLWVAATHPLDRETRHLLEFAANRQVALAIAPEADVRTLRTRVYESEWLWEVYLAGLDDGPEVCGPTPLHAPPPFSPDSPAGGAARALGLLVANAAARGSRWVQLQVAHGFTIVQHEHCSDSDPPFLWPGWVGSLLFAWCQVMGSPHEQEVFWCVSGSTQLPVRWLLDHGNSAKTILVEVLPSNEVASFRGGVAHQRPRAKALACPRCGATAQGHPSSVCPRCRLPVWRICRNCGSRFHASQAACSCCGAAATPASAALPAAPLAPTGHLLRTRPVGAPPTPLHVLVVDDQPDVRHCMASALQQIGVRVSSVGSGKEALALVNHDAPHLIVLDLVMPEVDGFEVIRRLRTSLRTVFTPVLAVTVLDPLDSSVGESLGPDDFCLQKPFPRHELLRHVVRMGHLTYGLDLGVRPGGTQPQARL
ncbi:Transcriptional activator protein CopR [bacterium HR30]|nr:Transcriptional activator protein CopR [bacterium HR30]